MSCFEKIMFLSESDFYDNYHMYMVHKIDFIEYVMT